LTHETIQADGWVEAYVRQKLTPQESAAFEEHYFACDRCFEQVQEMDKFIAGVRQAGSKGLLDNATAPSTQRWLMPAFVFATAVVLVLGAALSYLALIRMPAIDSQLRQVLADAERKAAISDRSAQMLALDRAPQTNVPVVILTAERAADSRSQLRIGSTGDAVFWIDVPPQPPGTKFNLTIAMPDTQFSKSIEGLERNQDGALAFSMPASELASGSYVVRLYQPHDRMIAEYRIDVSRK
jgi:hypothetical protein